MMLRRASWLCSPQTLFSVAYWTAHPRASQESQFKTHYKGRNLWLILIILLSVTPILGNVAPSPSKELSQLLLLPISPRSNPRQHHIWNYLDSLSLSSAFFAVTLVPRFSLEHWHTLLTLLSTSPVFSQTSKVVFQKWILIFVTPLLNFIQCLTIAMGRLYHLQRTSKDFSNLSPSYDSKGQGLGQEPGVCLQTILEESPMGWSCFWKTWDYLLKTSLCLWSSRQAWRKQLVWRKRNQIQGTQKQRKAGQNKSGSQKILWTEKQVSVTLLCVELKMQSETFHLGAPMGPKATLRVPHLCINSARSLLPECPLTTYLSD